eukprot:2768418-Rhodomonas_salina.1
MDIYIPMLERSLNTLIGNSSGAESNAFPVRFVPTLRVLAFDLAGLRLGVLGSATGLRAPYAPPTRCPVLTSRIVLPAVRITVDGNASELLGSREGRVRYLPTRLLCDVRY